ncbi:DNA translocase FtsK [Deinococcus sp. Marseille-Q6407]|uniref:DNA translocase FtsK n=1 Tax=Deinococcus sp. Marseille-Q6407 TaxID=2969223 RepID=UPI0021BE4583|nr:DNA translocase FtsK [Deinococcus sp. Marseille-Q6407]
MLGGVSKARSAQGRKSKSPASRRPAVAPAAGSPLDSEAIGLLLIALGLFLALSLLLPLLDSLGGGRLSGHQPQGGFNLTGTVRGFFVRWLGWAAYLLPVIPLGYGALIFTGRSLRRFSLRLLGGALVALSLSLLTAPFWPGVAGALAVRLLHPVLATVGLAALLLPLALLLLGLDLLRGQAPLSHFRQVGRGFSRAAVSGADRMEDLVQERREGREVARSRGALRGELRRHLSQLSGLLELRPEHPELKLQEGEVRAVLAEVRGLSEQDVTHYTAALQDWDRALEAAAVQEIEALRARLSSESQPAGDVGTQVEEKAEAIRRGRCELGAELHATQASAALDEVRHRLVGELTRLAQRAGRLERARSAADAQLAKAARNGKKAPALAARLKLLGRESRAHAGRQEGWQALADAWTDWQTLEPLFSGWPDLAAAYDRSPSEEAGAALAKALAAQPLDTLRERAAWTAALQDGTFPAPVGGMPAGQAAPVMSPAPASAAHPKPARARPAAAAKVAIEAEPPATDPALAFDFAGDVLEELAPAAPPAPTRNRSAASPVPRPGPTEEVDPAAEVEPADDWQPPAPLAQPAQRTADTPPWEGSRVGAARMTVSSHAAPERPQPQPQQAERPKQGALELALPSTDLLDPIPAAALNTAALDVSARQRAALIDQTLAEFNLQARVVDFARGPTVTRYEIEPAPGEKISRIASLSNDLARALAVAGVRIEAPVPGKSVIGLEVPNADREPVTFHQAVAAPSFQRSKAALPIILGKSIDGELLVGDLAKMPHLLIAGSTGSGKSVCVNTLINSLLFRFYPQELRFLMIDPKMVELTPYDGIPHLVRGVVTNPVDAAGVLLGAVAHMERRYKMMSQVGAKNLGQFNAKMRQTGEPELPHLIIIIDELADLMITSPKEVEAAIMRLAQMARATGMHLVLATQRPSVDILTSLIKVNVPARVAFAVSSGHDSRTILDSLGAERLTGMGDMLFYQPGLIKPVRLQGPFISEEESVRVTGQLKRMIFEDQFAEAYGADFDGAVMAEGPGADPAQMDFSDPYLRQAAQIVVEEGQGSVSRLQRRLSVGHARAGKLMDMLEAMGIVSKHQGSKPRDVLITEADLPEYFGR